MGLPGRDGRLWMAPLTTAVTNLPWCSSHFGRFFKLSRGMSSVSILIGDAPHLVDVRVIAPIVTDQVLGTGDLPAAA